MKLQTCYRRIGMLIGAALLTVTPRASVSAASSESLLSVTEESQIQPITDGSGKYLLKSDGFYCLNADGAKETAPAVHYFDHMEIDGTILNGYYYHDESGQFKAGSSHVVHIRQAVCNEESFDGYYMVNNLGKLSAAPQIRYMNQLALEGVTFDGYYYFDEYGKMVTEPGIHYVEMVSNGQTFAGDYYFGGTNGVLVQETGTTPEGFPVDATGKVGDLENLGMETLEPQIEVMLSGYEGEWSVYVKNLNTQEEFAVNNTPLYSASLIKAFVMAKTYENMDTVLEHEAKKMNAKPEDAAVQKKVDDLLWNMITVSDNESCNELARLQSESGDFLEGAKAVNRYIRKEGYADTTLQSTLHPSSSPALSLGEHNMTTVKDCGLLLERIFKGECVSPEASEKMLNLLLNQQNLTKIPVAVDENIAIANKTGETDSDQHDMAIVYGPKTTYILCVMSQDWTDGNAAIGNIREISKVVYNYLNLYESGEKQYKISMTYKKIS